MDYYVTIVTAYGADVVAGPFDARDAAESLRRWCSGTLPAVPPGHRGGEPSSGAGADRSPSPALAYAVATGAELRTAWARGHVYRW
jgi:hypothetical protein